MSGRSTRPPRLARALVSRLTPASHVEFILGDLDDDFAESLGARGVFASRLRYWRLALGSIGASRQVAPERDRRRAGLLATSGQDVRFAVRVLRKHRGLTAVAVITLALGIGTNTAIFSVMNGVLLRPLPYEEPAALVNVWQVFRDWQRSEVASLRARAERFQISWPVYREWRERSRTLADLAAYKVQAAIVERQDAADWIGLVETTTTLPTVLGVQPVLGRWFDPADVNGGTRVAVVSHGFAQRWFGGVDAALGDTVRLTGTPFTVIGVMPAEFYFPGRDQEVWIPIPESRRNDRWTSQSLEAIARLGPGVSIDRAQAEMDAVAAQIMTDIPDAIDAGVRLVSRVDEMAGTTGPTLVLLMGSVALVLAIATANVAGLLLVHVGSRRQELAIRLALGARRSRIVTQMLTESLVLACLGGAGGLLALTLTFGWVRTLLPPATPRMADIAVDWRVVAFATFASATVAVVIGVASAVRALRMPAADGLRDDGPRLVGHRRGRSALVVAEVAVSVVLLAGAVLLTQSYLRLTTVERGFDAAGRLTATITAPLSMWGDTTGLQRFFDDTLVEASALPGVSAAGAVSSLPFGGGQSSSGFGLVSNPVTEADEGWSLENRVTPGYFEAMGIRLLRGRFLNADDLAGRARVVVVNERLARTYFPDRDPLGQRIWEAQGDPPEIVGLEIVGVVGDLKHARLSEQPESKRYWAFAQDTAVEMTLVLRTDGDPTGLAPAVREVVHRIEPLAAVRDVATMDGLLASATALPRFRMLMLGALAAIAVALAMIGVYGVVAFTVADRTREIGLRISLGARSTDILRQVLAGGLRLILPGLALGTVAALAATRLLDSYLFDVAAGDPAVLTGVAVAVGLVAIAATLLPAKRAARVDPLTALRGE